MPSDADRRALFSALQDHLGERPATVLMELLPDVTSSELARQPDLVAVRGEMAQLRGELKGEMSELRGEMAEVRGEMAELRAELRGGLAMVNARIDGQVPRFLLASVPMTLGFGGLVLAAAKLA